MLFVMPRRALLLGTLSACSPTAPSPEDVDLAFVRDHDDGTSELRGLVLEVGEVPLRDPSPEGTSLGRPQWSRDGSRIAISHTSDGERTVEILEPGLGEIATFSNALSPRWSPTRDELLVLRPTDPEPETEAIVILGADDDGDDARTLGVGAISSVSWSPEGDRIAILGTLADQDPGAALFIADRDATTIDRIDVVPPNATEVHVFEAEWSPTDETIAFVRIDRLDSRYSRLFTVESDGTNMREVPTGDVYGVDSPSWSPDGEMLAVAAWYFDAVQPSDSGILLHDRGIKWMPRATELAWSSDLERTATVELVTLDERRILLDGPGVGDWEPSNDDSGDSDRSPAWRPSDSVHRSTDHRSRVRQPAVVRPCSR